MVQRVPDEETLRRMSAAHAHEEAEHGGTARDWASHDTREMKLALWATPTAARRPSSTPLTGSNQYVGNWPGVTVEKKGGQGQRGR